MQHRTAHVVDEKEGKSNNCEGKQSFCKIFFNVEAVVDLGASHSAALLLKVSDTVLNFRSAHNGLKKVHLVYFLFTVLPNCCIHTDSVLGDVAAKGLKRKRKNQLLVFYCNKVRTLSPYLSVADIGVEASFL